MRPFLVSAFIFVGSLVPTFAVAGQIQPSGFHITIIDGEGALNNIKGRIAREPIVQVEDKNHKRVVGAYVVFDTPSSGPSGVFADGTTRLVTNTDEYGDAVARGLRPNNISGNFDIHVHVTYQGQSLGDVTIHQINVSGQLAKLSKNLDSNSASVDVAAGQLGVVVGEDFLVNGAAAPGKVNLANGASIRSRSSTLKLYVYQGCEILVAPHSTVTIEPSLVDLHSGTLRARQFGNCKISYGALLILAFQSNADAVVGIAGGKLEVASLTGTLQVRAADRTIVDTIKPGVVSSFQNLPTGAGTTSGASIAAPAHFPLYYLAFLGGSIGALGIAIETLSQPATQTISP
jgi:hypothetical protein